jgi:exosortase
VPLFAVAALAVLTLPVWRWLWGEWMANDYYSHGVLIPPVSLFLAYQRFKHDRELVWRPGSGNSAGLLVLGVSLLLYLFFLNNKTYYMAAFATIGLIYGTVWTLGGGQAARRLAFPIGYLAFMVPLPFIERTTLPLAMFTGVCSGAMVQFLGLEVSIVGNSVTLPNADLVIGAQCSGINSLIALTALTTLAAYLLDGPLWGRMLLVALSIPLAMLGNILRVASLLFVARDYGAEAAFVYYHDYSGPVFFVLMLILLLPLAWLLRCRNLRTEVI